jgi:hypothetical protein
LTSSPSDRPLDVLDDARKAIALDENLAKAWCRLGHGYKVSSIEPTQCSRYAYIHSSKVLPDHTRSIGAYEKALSIIAAKDEPSQDEIRLRGVAEANIAKEKTALVEGDS